MSLAHKKSTLGHGMCQTFIQVDILLFKLDDWNLVRFFIKYATDFIPLESTVGKHDMDPWYLYP